MLEPEVAMAINARVIAVIVIAAGLILAIIGGVALASDVTVLASGNTTVCGSAAKPDLWQSSAACQSAIATREIWAWGMLIVGGLAALGTLILFPSRRPGVQAPA